MEEVELIVTSVEALGAELSARGVHGRLVALDGFEGSGKSTLGAALASILPATHIAGDSFLGPKREDEDYLAQLRWDELAGAVSAGVRGGQTTVLDAVFALDILARLQHWPFVLVYVKKITAAGLWHRGFDLEEYATEPALGSSLELRLMEYHLRRKPHQSADIIYERPEFNADSG